MFLSRKSGLQWTDRGDALAYDFDKTAFTADSTWRTLELPVIVPTNAILVQFRMQFQVPAGNAAFMIKPYNQAHDFSAAICYTQGISIRSVLHPIVAIYEHKVKCWLQNISPITQCYLHVIGWYI